MVPRMLTGLLLLGLAGCGGKGDQQQAAADSLRRDLQLAPVESTTAMNDQPAAAVEPAPSPAPEPAPPPAPTPAPKPKPAPAPKPKPAPAKPAEPAEPALKVYTAASGTTVSATAQDSLHSRHDKGGATFHAAISEDVKDAGGGVVIPAGSVVTFTVVKLEHAGNKSAKDGQLRLEAQMVTIGGRSYAINGTADQTTVQHALVGQGVTAGGAAKVGGGAAAGAILGKVIGGKTGAIVGGVAGAAAGTAAAVQTADRDVVVAPGNSVVFTIGVDFSITR